MADIYTKIRAGSCGPGGLKCYCCNPKTDRGNGKRRIMRHTNRRARMRLNAYVPLFED